jgi:hypothetical protein
VDVLADWGKTQWDCTSTTQAAAAAEEQDADQSQSAAMRGVGRVRGNYCILPPARCVKRQMREGGLLPGLSWRPPRPHRAQAVPASASRRSSPTRTRRHTARADVTLLSRQDTSTPLILSTDQQAAATESQRCMKQPSICAQTRPVGAGGAERLWAQSGRRSHARVYSQRGPDPGPCNEDPHGSATAQRQMLPHECPHPRRGVLRDSPASPFVRARAGNPP